MKRILLASLCALLGSLTLFARVQSAPPYSFDNYSDDSIQEKGFWWGAELLGGVLANDLSVYGPLQAQLVAGYRFGDLFQIGGGAGVRYYVNNPYRASRSGIAVPLFLDLRGLMISGESRMVVPCWSLDVGYTFFDGFMFSPLIGLRIGDDERHHFIAGISYLGQLTKLKVEGIDMDGFLNGLMIKLAYEF